MVAAESYPMDRSIGSHIQYPAHADWAWTAVWHLKDFENLHPRWKIVFNIKREEPIITIIIIKCKEGRVGGCAGRESTLARGKDNYWVTKCRHWNFGIFYGNRLCGAIRCRMITSASTILLLFSHVVVTNVEFLSTSHTHRLRLSLHPGLKESRVLKQHSLCFRYDRPSRCPTPMTGQCKKRSPASHLGPSRFSSYQGPWNLQVPSLGLATSPF